MKCCVSAGYSETGESYQELSQFCQQSRSNRQCSRVALRCSQLGCKNLSVSLCISDTLGTSQLQWHWRLCSNCSFLQTQCYEQAVPGRIFTSKKIFAGCLPEFTFRYLSFYFVVFKCVSVNILEC